jgi:hypothetical protein
MKKLLLILLTALALTAAIGSSNAAAQGQPSAAAHWEGPVDVAGTPLEIVVDLSRTPSGNWVGQIAIPAQSLKEYPLAAVKVEGSTVSFEMRGLPGTPTLKGKVSEDGKTLTGEMAQGGQTFPFKLTRKGDSEIKVVAVAAEDKGTAGPSIEGVWQGLLDTGGPSLKLIIKFSKAADGTLTGSLDSPDQQRSDMPINTITRKGDTVHFEMKYIGAVFDGKLNKDASEMSGTWDQGGASFPLLLKRGK